MKTFATVLFLTAAVCAKDLPDMENPHTGADGEIVDIEAEPELTPEEQAALYWESVEERNFYFRNMWLGVFQGLYGMGGKVERPTEDCFGDWIPEKMHDLSKFRETAGESLWLVSMDEAAKAAYGAVDLLFLNDQYCHFRKTFWDVHQYCTPEVPELPEVVEGEEQVEIDIGIPEPSECAISNVMENMQKNAFNIITQVSSAAAIFKQQPWEEMDKESRAYALNQMGHSMSSLFADLVGFNAMKVPAYH